MPTATFTYSQTGDFGYNAGQETKTIEWVISSSLPIQGGTFLDGSPWVLNNGDINLISTSPASANVPIKSLRREAFDPSLNGSPVSIQTLNVDINNTVINPDVGKALTNNGFTDIPLVRADNSGITTPSQIFIPWDGRLGQLTAALSYDSIGTAYDGTQKWNRQPKKLNNGDMVAVAISHYSPPTGNEQIISGLTGSVSNLVVLGVFDGNPYSNTQHLYRLSTEGPHVDMIGTLTVVSSIPPQNSFRPPCNWDPLDRANAPIFQEVNDLEDVLIEYPNYSIESDTKNWSQTAYQKYLTDPRYSDMDPYRFLYKPGAWQQQTSRDTRLYVYQKQSAYGGDTTKALETQLFTAHTAETPPAIRARIRRTMVQRGIDLFGAKKSLGKMSPEDGGWFTDYYPLEILACIVTGSQEILNALSGYSKGNAQNGTFKLLSDIDFTIRDRKRYGYGSLSQQIRFPEGMKDRDFICAARWKNLTIKQILTGTSTPYGDYQLVRVKAPELLPVGVAFPEDPTRIATWNRDTLYNISSTVTGKWNLSSNTNKLESSYVIGGYLRSGNSITRIIRAKVVPKDTPTNLTIQQYDALAESSSTNDDLLLWTQTNIFSGNETVLDMNSNIKEDLSEGVVFFTTYSQFKVSQYPVGFYYYGYNPLAYLPLWGYYYTICIEKDIPVSYPLYDSYKFAKWFTKDYLRMFRYFVPLVSNYNNTDGWYLSLFRKYLNPSGPLSIPQNKTPNIYSSYSGYLVSTSGNYTGIRAAWAALPEAMTWIDFMEPPPNITVASNDANTNTNPVSFYRENETTQIGRLRPCQLKRDIDNPNKVVIEMKSSTQYEPRLAYSYVENKTLYLWVGGASKPIKMKKKSETITSTSWTQIWEFPDNKSNIMEFFPTYTQNPLRMFFADEDPRFDEQLSFAERLARLLGSWGSNNSTYDLNEDGIVDQQDLSILLGQWDASNDLRILVFASPAGDAHTYEEVAIDTYVKLEGTGRDGIYKVIDKYSDNKTFTNGLKYTILEFGPRLRSVKGANIVTVRPPIQQEAV